MSRSLFQEDGRAAGKPYMPSDQIERENTAIIGINPLWNTEIPVYKEKENVLG